MIDIHTHILPYIDDGAKDTEEALKMIRYLALQGVDMAVCTPHFDPLISTIEEFIEKRDKALQAIYTSDITLISASETRYQELLYEYSALDPICIGKSRYLLLELPYKENWSDYDIEDIEKLMSLYNVIPIIAHIERYKALWKSKKAIRQLMSLGCIVQINAGTIIDINKRKTALHYIKNGLVDVIGSDCHNMSKRPPNLKDAYAIIDKEIGIYYCDLLQQNAASIIKGKGIREDIGRLMLRGSES
jgi:protein-tyrosine phosphatase